MRSTDEETKRTIARKVVEPLSNLDRLSKKAAWFDKGASRTMCSGSFKQGLLG